MYEGNEIRGNRSKGAMLGGSDVASQTISNAPIDQAILDLEKEIGCLGSQVGMLLERLSPISKPALKEETKPQDKVPNHCQLEGRINASKDKLTELYFAVSSARDALCI